MVNPAPDADRLLKQARAHTERASDPGATLSARIANLEAANGYYRRLDGLMTGGRRAMPTDWAAARELRSLDDDLGLTQL